VTTERDADRRDDQYFAADPDVASDAVDVEVVVPGAAFTLRTDRGVFSRGRLDTGTGVLLRLDHPLPREGTLVDLGCGAGPIALTMAKRSPATTVWAIDVNTRARELCRFNAARAGLANVVVAAPEEAPDDLCVDALWSNPPIRIGKDPLHGLLTVWLDRLAPTGRALLVVHKHLGGDSLARWLTDHGREVERVASKAGFRVLEVHPSTTS
jgi:16S rRNA (guanine1207-N2)-methyltransferase